MTEEIMVSIICNAYNHEKYISDALGSFVSQNTSFKFEVLVHDDASIDKTADIIKDFEMKYPDIIKPIYQRENQHSKGFSINYDIQIPRAKGKYLAFCEGDDYWTDGTKLEKCISFLEKNESYGAVFHKTSFLNCKTGENGVLGLNTESDCDYSFKDGLENKCHTSSFFFRREVLNQRMPKYLFSLGIVEDWPLKIFLADYLRCRYFNETMSLYRFLSGSTSASGEWHANSKMNKNIWLIKRDIYFKQLVFKGCSKENKIVVKRSLYQSIHTLVHYRRLYFRNPVLFLISFHYYVLIIFRKFLKVISRKK